MRVMVVHSGHGFSTKDVGDGLCMGLRAQGVEVVEYPLMHTLESMDLIVGAARLMDIDVPGGYPDVFQMASMGIPGMAMAKSVEAVIFIHGLNVPPSIPATLKRGGYTTALLCTETPYQIEQEKNIAQFYDVIFTNDRAGVPLFSLNRPDTVHYLPHAYNPLVHTPEGEKAEPCDVFFVGTKFPERAALLDGVDWSNINLVERTIDYSSGKPTAALLAQITPNERTATYYRSAFISLCHHRADPTGLAESLNPRCYEVPACGGFLISDVRAELFDIFGRSVPTYTDSASLESLVRYFMAHPQERDTLAARQREAIASHTWPERARDMLGILAAHRTQATEELSWVH
jgi:hypothetical protein